jgi:acetyl esterase/lipase
VRFGRVQIPVDGGEITAYVYRPSNKPEEDLCPFLINFHGEILAPGWNLPLKYKFTGGGFCFNNAAMDHQPCCNFVLDHGLSVMNVEYRLAPEYPFPIPVNDCYSALKWVNIFCQSDHRRLIGSQATSHGAQLGADFKKGLLVCGGSSGELT